ncbi:lasso peptide biosynthesis B2 protein [Paraglaciecola sp.]|uniref:lasso peptide biosynthesis B2 protein n=1 Tax=Paraglaciecola sp. TaxID=1920173 RepID=UPI0030F48CA9
MNKPLNTLLALRFKQQLVVYAAWLLFMVWHFKISYLPYRWWRKSLSSYAAIQEQPDIHLRAMQIVGLIEKAGRHHFIKINCLRRCMVQKQLLHWHNINSQLSIGVKKEQGKFAAHCWLVVNNHIINDSPEETQSYAELQRLQPGENQDASAVKNLV